MFPKYFAVILFISADICHILSSPEHKYNSVVMRPL